LRRPRDCRARDDLDRLLNCLDVFRPELLPGREIRCLSRAQGGEIVEVLLVSIPRGGGVLQVALRLRLVLQLLGPRFCLVIHVLRRLLNLRLEILDQHREGVQGVRLQLRSHEPVLHGRDSWTVLHAMPPFSGCTKTLRLCDWLRLRSPCCKPRIRTTWTLRNQWGA
jgi:hypothetical protein